MNKNDYIIRLEKESDYRNTEDLVRNAFWNVYCPGCREHYVLHVLRNDTAFVNELDFVMEQAGRLIAQVVFVRAEITTDDGKIAPVLTMGPIGVLPEFQGRGIGKIILDYSLQKAAQLGFGAVLIEGNMGFYGKSGFTFAKDYGIRYHGLPDGVDTSFFLCKELIPGYLNNITGEYSTPAAYFVDDYDVEQFDKNFPTKEKLKLDGQIF